LSVQGREDRDYYDAWRQLGQGTMTDPLRHEQIPGKYAVLNFESPEGGLVYGIDAEVATFSLSREKQILVPQSSPSVDRYDAGHVVDRPGRSDQVDRPDGPAEG